MTVTDVRKDPSTCSMEVISEFDAPIDAVWQMWADPRRLERWWGPPTYPATFVDHDLTAGGRVTYFLTGPEGDTHHGWWKVIAVAAPDRLEVEDGFADEHGVPNLEMPVTRMVVTLEAVAEDRTRMTMASTFPSVDAMEQMIAMGMEEGIKEALGQIDALLGLAADAG